MMIGQYLIGGYQIISHLNISSVKTEDGGEYTCYAKSKAGEQYHSARLNVYGPIYVRKMPPITAIAGKTLQIKCPVSGYPIEGIVWEKGDFKNSRHWTRFYKGF
jgi:Immunoglobulin I-set domain